MNWTERVKQIHKELRDHPSVSSVPREITTFYELMIRRNYSCSTFEYDSFEELVEAYYQRVNEILGAIAVYRDTLNQVRGEVECTYLNSLMVEYQTDRSNGEKYWCLSKVVSVDVARDSKDGVFRCAHNDAFDWAYPFQVSGEDIINAVARFKNSDGTPNVKAFEFSMEPIVQDCRYLQRNKPTERKLADMTDVQRLILQTVTRAL